MRAEHIRARLGERGWTVLPAGTRPAGGALDAWTFVESLIGERPTMVERQPIRPIEGGRSFASTRGFTPLHTDSQDFLGAPPGLQIMLCHQPAQRGGETRLVDGWALLASLERTDPGLHRALFTESRTIPFYFGAVTGTTVAEKNGALVLTVSPMPPPPTDRVGVALASAVEDAAVIEVRVERDEILLVDNHRMLHGRRAFDGDDRAFLRLLAWLPTPISRPAHHLAYARSHASVGPLGSPHAVGAHRAAVVIEMISGVPPAKLAAREGIPEADLYRWRTEAFRAAARALDD